MTLMPENCAGEFMRRLKHQLELLESHARVCSVPPATHSVCRTGKLITHAIKDSASTLKSIGYAREATDMVRATMIKMGVTPPDLRGTAATD